MPRDLTEQQRMEEALAKRTAELEDARSFLDSVLENLPVMLFVKDAKDLKFIRWNRAEEEALGIDRSAAGIPLPMTSPTMTSRQSSRCLKKS